MKEILRKEDINIKLITKATTKLFYVNVVEIYLTC